MSFELHELGWDAEWARVFAPYAADGLVPARVAIEFNYIYRLYAESGELQAQHAGRMRHQAEGRENRSAVGDWVAVLPTPGEAAGTIEAVLPRRSRFSRKVAGETTEEQIVAANIDTVFLVMGLDGDYNPRRLERYLLMAYESGARPVVLLNKSDVADHLPADLDEIKGLGVGIPVYPISARERSGIDVIERYLGPGRTGALLGSSGVGKSTIVNALMGDEKLKTRDVRASDSRGRHTTRHRHLILLGTRGLLIDTPGMRELQLWDDTGGLEEAFEDISAVAGECHFRDCRHEQEPGCAVLLAVADGSLPQERLDSYRKLQRELHHLHLKQDRRAASEQRRKHRVVQRSRRGTGRNVGRSTND